MGRRKQVHRRRRSCGHDARSRCRPRDVAAQEVDALGTGHSAARAIAAATTTFSESTPASSGMRTLACAICRAASDSPLPSAPANTMSRSAVATSGRVIVQWNRRLARRQCHYGEPVLAKDPQCGWPRLESVEGQAHHGADRGADRFPVQRIAARRIEKNAVAAKRLHDAKKAADVVGICDALHAQKTS